MKNKRKIYLSHKKNRLKPQRRLSIHTLFGSLALNLPLPMLLLQLLQLNVLTRQISIDFSLGLKPGYFGPMITIGFGHKSSITVLWKKHNVGKGNGE